MQRKHVELLVVVCCLCTALALIANHYHQQALQDQFLDAVTRDDAPAVLALLDRGVDPIHRKPVGVTAIGLASARQASRTLMALLKRGAKPASEDLYPPALADKREMVEALLQAGADPNYISKNTRPLLTELAARGTPGMLQLVIAHGANVEGTPNRAWYATSSLSPLMSAIEARRFDCARVLLDAGANVDARFHTGGANFDNYTCLMMTAYGGQTESVKLLLAYHPDIYLTGTDGKSALRLAQERHHLEIVALLQQAIKQNHRTPTMSSSLHGTDDL